MTLRVYIWGMRFITALALFALALIIIYIDPQKSAPVGVILFGLVFFLALGGMFNLFLHSIRKKFLGSEAAALSVGLSFRQGMLMSLMVVGILILQNFRVLIWWDAFLVIAGVFLIELYFLSKS